MSPVHTDRSEVYQQNEVAGKPISGSGLKYLGWSGLNFITLCIEVKIVKEKL